MLQGKETKKYPYSSSSSFFAARFSVPPAYTPGNKFNEITISCTCEAQCPIRTVQEREVGNGPQGIRITEPRVKVYKLCRLLAVHTGAGIPPGIFFITFARSMGVLEPHQHLVDLQDSIVIIHVLVAVPICLGTLSSEDPCF